MSMPTVLVTNDPPAEARALYREILGDCAEVVFLPDAPADGREAALGRADAMIGQNPRLEIDADDVARMRRLRFVQLLTAGVDHVPLHLFPADVAIASNAGVFAEPMAEHVVAMILAAAKRLPVEHREMREGRFNQFVPTKQLAGSVCAILGYGGVGRAAARMLRALGVRIRAVNRSGRTDDAVDFAATLDDLERAVRGADIVVVTLPLTGATRGRIGARELDWMADDAILVNVARGEIVDQDALFARLTAAPGMFACLDAWWVEPVRHGEFRIDHPFLDLPNVIASPHNSATAPGTQIQAVRQGAGNVRRWLRGERPENLLAADERGR